MELKEKKCKPCEGDTSPLRSQQISHYLEKLDTNWEVIDNAKIRQTYTFNNFREALDFANQVGEIAEKEQHHPDLHVYYGKVTVELSTHAIGGLSENDFIMASKIEDI